MFLIQFTGRIAGEGNKLRTICSPVVSRIKFFALRHKLVAWLREEDEAKGDDERALEES